MRFYAACLAAYNNGRLHGEWIDASDDLEAMQGAIGTMLKASPERGAEEWAIHDYEGLPRCFGEYSGLATIAAFVELVEKAEDDHGLDADAMTAIVDHYGSVKDADDALERLVTHCSSFRDYADEYADEMMAGEAHDSDKRESYASRYFDYESHARDLEMDMTVVDIASGVAIFHD